MNAESMTSSLDRSRHRRYAQGMLLYEVEVERPNVSYPVGRFGQSPDANVTEADNRTDPFSMYCADLLYMLAMLRTRLTDCSRV